MFIGIGTVVNVATVLVGSVLGVLIGHRLRQRTRDLVTDALGLVTLLIAITSALTVGDAALSDAVGDSAPVLIVLGAMLIGGITGSLLRIEERLEGFGSWLQHRFSRDDGESTFVEGFVSASMVFCVGPLTFLGALSDGLGRGADQLFLKAILDGFASIAFAASLGWGVAASALVVLVLQGLMTAVGAVLGMSSRGARDRAGRHWRPAADRCRPATAQDQADRRRGPAARPDRRAAAGPAARCHPQLSWLRQQEPRSPRPGLPAAVLR